MIENGQLSLEVSRREGESSRDGLVGHSHTSDEGEDYWRVFWNLADLRDSSPNPPAKTAYLGHYEAHFDDKGRFARKDQGLKLSESYYTGDMHVLVWKASQMLSPKLPLTEPPALWGQIPFGQMQVRVLSRSRKTLFVLSPTPALFDAHSLRQVRALPLTESFTKFRKLAEKGLNLHRTVLTDNLRFLIAVPHNGGESPQGFNHYKACCYDIEHDTFVEHKLHFGQQTTRIDDVECIDDRLLFVVGDGGGKEAIVDENSVVQADLSLIGGSINPFSPTLMWDWQNQRVFLQPSIFDETSFAHGGHAHERRLLEFNYATKILRTLVLKVPDLPQP